MSVARDPGPPQNVSGVYALINDAGGLIRPTGRCSSTRSASDLPPRGVVGPGAYLLFAGRDLTGRRDCPAVLGRTVYCTGTVEVCGTKYWARYPSQAEDRRPAGARV